MDEQGLEAYSGELNCAQRLLCAAGEEEAARLCAGMGRGFGIGGMCGAALAGAMLASKSAEDPMAARARVLWMLTEFYGRYGSLDCAVIRRGFGEDCALIIQETARLVSGCAD